MNYKIKSASLSCPEPAPLAGLGFEAADNNGAGAHAHPGAPVATKAKMSRLILKEITDKPGVHEWTDKGQILINHNFQRQRISISSINRIASEWSWAALGTLSLALLPDGHLYVYDGQHRLLASIKRPDVIVLPCMIHEMSHERFAALAFRRINKNRHAVPSYEDWRIAVASGDDVAINVKRMVEQVGYRVVPSASKAPGTVSAIAALQTSYRSDPECCNASWAVCCEVAAGSFIHNEMIRGTSSLERALKSKTSESLLDDRNLEKLRQEGQANIVHLMDSYATMESGTGGEGPWSRALIDILNKGRRKYNRLPRDLVS